MWIYLGREHYSFTLRCYICIYIKKKTSCWAQFRVRNDDPQRTSTSPPPPRVQQIAHHGPTPSAAGTPRPRHDPQHTRKSKPTPATSSRGGPTRSPCTRLIPVTASTTPNSSKALKAWHYSVRDSVARSDGCARACAEPRFASDRSRATAASACSPIRSCGTSQPPSADGPTSAAPGSTNGRRAT